MATFKIRGTSFCAVYPYRTEQNEKKQQWESYASELEAIQKKAYIDYLQKNGMRKEILAAVVDYRALIIGVNTLAIPKNLKQLQQRLLRILMKKRALPLLIKALTFQKHTRILQENGFLPTQEKSI